MRRRTYVKRVPLGLCRRAPFRRFTSFERDDTANVHAVLSGGSQTGAGSEGRTGGTTDNLTATSLDRFMAVTATHSIGC
jgi:hypothetical protein